MFPRLPRVARLGLLLVCLSLSILIMVRTASFSSSSSSTSSASGGDHHQDAPDMPPFGGGGGGSDVILGRRLPSPNHQQQQQLPSTTSRHSGSRLTSSLLLRKTTSGRRLTPRSSPSRPLPLRTSAHLLDLPTKPGKPVVNPHNFRYLLNPRDACVRRERDSGGTGGGDGGAGGHVSLLVYVHAAPANLKKRQSIRETWGEPGLLRRYNASLVFIMGTVADPRLQQLVLMESEQYGDIVQEDFLDSYRNLTYKAVAGLRWAADFCPGVDFILKTDDDILVNIHQVVKHIRDAVVPRYGRRRLILCNQWVRMKIIREKRSKWYVPEDEFPGEFFPAYCSGSAFLLSGDMARLMFHASLVTRFFWVDDYYITGALIKELNVTHRRLNQAYSLNPSVAEQKYRGDKKRELFFFHLHKLRVFYGLWRNMTAESGVSTQSPALSFKALASRFIANQPSSKASHRLR